jgi:hypothetical protein
MELKNGSFIDSYFLPTVAVKVSALNKINKITEAKYSLHKFKIKNNAFYSFHFMPFLKKKMIKKLVADLRES